MLDNLPDRDRFAYEPGVLRGDLLAHPCDTGLGVLFKPINSGQILYLLDSGPGSKPNDRVRFAVAPAHRATTGVDHQPMSDTVDSFLRLDETTRLPIGNDQIQLAVVALCACWPRHPKAQQQLLSEIRRVLAGDGEILLLARNRLDLRSLARKLRPPRPSNASRIGLLSFLQDSVTHVLFHARLPTWNYLVRLLRNTGFDAVEGFETIRSRDRRLVEIRPLAAAREGWQQSRHRVSWFDGVRRPPWLVGEFVLRATRSTLDRSALDRCLDDLSGVLGTKNTTGQFVRIQRLLVTAKEKLIMLADFDGQALVTRIPFSEAAYQGSRQNMQTLRALHDLPGRRALWPTPLAECHGHGFYHVTESRLTGHSLRELADEDTDLDMVARLLTALNPPSLLRHEILEGPLYDRLVGRPLARILSEVESSHARQRLAQVVFEHLHGQRVTIGITHGDFSLSNVMTLDGQENLGVIDWDDSSLENLPALNAISYLCSRQIRRGRGFAETILAMATRQGLAPEELAFLECCYANCDTPPQDHSSCVLLNWLQVVSGLLDYWFVRDSRFLESRIGRIVDHIEKSGWSR